ncbi:hypothetical protein DPEC_G00336870 [Dallia pectoralis]|uniref:Uncharacterized protein n=1 Tax=Dallia pectoralis TaxID=75939 RepID=A0ACC2F7D7_DALPE|nr:hypothetical protein DPEC_G00336870 [Dallia pectoralis]
MFSNVNRRRKEPGNSASITLSLCMVNLYHSVSNNLVRTYNRLVKHGPDAIGQVSRLHKRSRPDFRPPFDGLNGLSSPCYNRKNKEWGCADKRQAHTNARHQWQIECGSPAFNLIVATGGPPCRVTDPVDVPSQEPVPLYHLLNLDGYEVSVALVSSTCQAYHR